MKHSYVTLQMQMAFRKHRNKKTDIHISLAETIAERNKVLAKWEAVLSGELKIVKQQLPVSIHDQLARTIAEYKRMKGINEKIQPMNWPGPGSREAA